MYIYNLMKCNDVTNKDSKEYKGSHSGKKKKKTVSKEYGLLGYTYFKFKKGYTTVLHIQTYIYRHN